MASDSDNEIEFTGYMVREPTIKLKYVDIHQFLEVCNYFSFPLLQLVDCNERIECYALLHRDVKVIVGRWNGEEAYVDDDVAEVTRIDKTLIKTLRGPPKSVDGYLFQKLMWPSEKKELYAQLRKKVEFEIVSELMRNPHLHGMCVFNHQKVILGYKADCLFTIRTSSLVEGTEIPEVVLEIDEDGHRNYTKEEEEKRANLIKSFGYRLVRVSAPRKTTQEGLQTIINETADRLITIFSDLILQYNPTITDEQFIKEAEENDIDRDLLRLYFPKPNEKKEGPFFIPLEKVGEYLGYSEDKNGHESLKSLVRRQLDPKDDYEISDFSGVNPGKVHPEKKPMGRPKKYYYLTRYGFHLVCIYSRKTNSTQAQIKLAKLSVVSLDYAKKIKAMLLSNVNNRSTERVNAVNERIDYLKGRDKSKKEISALKKENKELKEANTTLTTRVEDLEKKLEEEKKEASRRNLRFHLKVAEGIEREDNIYDYFRLSIKTLKKRCDKKDLEYDEDADKEALIRLLME